MEDEKLAAPCGLYCGACIAYVVSKRCHGCGCKCGKCIASECQKECVIYECCVKRKGLKACYECEEFPCSMLIQFSRDPVWLTHLTVLENLLRRKNVGTEKWLKEQRRIWTNDKYFRKWLWFQKECVNRAKQFEKEKTTMTSEKKQQ